MVAAFQDVIFALKPWEISQVLDNEGSFYLFRMEPRQTADPKTINFEDKGVQQVIATLMAEEPAEAWKAKYFRQCVEKTRLGK